ncbi:MAG: hypothetical protein QOJ85_1911 [Solirubrobacteraceae bacterium]|jgi:hypothetical protein|nr:hypothetical protein [Solirubrobacteraceae bacterium]MEA2242669.1 hypothetical protein [Solirubrobacteraceae bacterium]
MSPKRSLLPALLGVVAAWAAAGPADASNRGGYVDVGTGSTLVRR